MSRIWAYLARFFHKLARRSSRGKAIRDQYGWSARQQAFDYFNKGLRPSQLPDLGVQKTTKYRYFQQWKNRYEKLHLKMAKKMLALHPASREWLAQKLGISEEALVKCIKQSRTAAQLKRALYQTENKQFEMLIEQGWRLSFEAVVSELQGCCNMEERWAKLGEVSKRLGVTRSQFIIQLGEMNQKLGLDALLRRVLGTMRGMR